MDEIKEDLPKAKTPSKGKKILVYGLAAIIGLIVLTALYNLPPAKQLRL